MAVATAVGTAMAFATCAATASSALAGDHDTDSYTVNISPSSVPAGSSTDFHVTLKNTSSPGSGLDSAVIVPPRGFQVTSASVPAGSGSASVYWNAVFLRHLSLSPGSSVTAKVTATAPSRCSARPRHWHSDANEGGFWSEDLRLDRDGSSLTTTVNCGVALQFLGQPNNTIVGQHITGNSYDTSGPPVTVEIVDAGGNVVDTTGTLVTVALTNPPGGSGALGGTATEPTKHGVATFSDLSVDQPNNNYTLTASSPGLTNATSNPFNENNSVTPCPANQTCSGSLSTPNTSITIDVGSGPEDATLTEAVDVGTPQNSNPGCASYAPRSPDWYEFVVSQSDRSKTVTWTVNSASPDGFEVCFGAPYDFAVGFNSDSGAPILAPAGTLPDGTPGFVGLLTGCRQLGSAEATNPCVSSLSTNDNGGTIVVVTIPAGLAGDPFMGR